MPPPASALTASPWSPISRPERRIGELLRHWRQHRRLSQLALACDAGISTRHLSFLETGRSQPSREMLLRLADRLEVPARDRNTLLVAAGFAPMYSERPLTDPSMAAARRAIETVLAGHEPCPAIAINRHWTLEMSNRALAPFLEGVAPLLLEPPVNVLRLSLHPGGLAPRIANLASWRAHLLARLQRQIQASTDPVLIALEAELSHYPAPSTPTPVAAADAGRDFADIAAPLLYVTPRGTLSFISTTMVFGTPVDLTLAELAIETFLPADEATQQALRAWLRR